MIFNGNFEEGEIFFMGAQKDKIRYLSLEYINFMFKCDLIINMNN